MRVKDIILGLMSLALIGAGAFLIVTFFLNPGSPLGSSASGSQDFNMPTLEDTQARARKALKNYRRAKKTDEYRALNKATRKGMSGYAKQLRAIRDG